jgi:hypothetical protein
MIKLYEFIITSYENFNNFFWLIILLKNRGRGEERMVTFTHGGLILMVMAFASLAGGIEPEEHGTRVGWIIHNSLDRNPTTVSGDGSEYGLCLVQ